jgi:hypothetical protein
VVLSAKEGLAARSPSFADARALFVSGDVTLEADGRPLDVDSLPLADFHALRAIATHLGWLEEEVVEIACLNCDHPIEHTPCAALPIGPFEERALRDPELDATLPLGEPHLVAHGESVTFGPLSLGEALPLHAALGRRRFRVTESVVRAMGIVELGDARSPAAIAEKLRAADNDFWGIVTNLFLEAHYPPRLFSMARCSECGARNDVDAPYEREFIYQLGETDPPTNTEEEFVSFDAFAERARASYEELVPEEARGELTFLVEGGVPACDDGGVPLLGSYVPPSPGDAASPSRAGEIAVFYRTFRAMWSDEGGYDWRAELEETIEHEFEHHLGALRGDDPMDEDEREEIDAEARRIHGERTLVRRDAAALADDFYGFWKRTWPLWIVLLIIAVAMRYFV